MAEQDLLFQVVHEGPVSPQSPRKEESSLSYHLCFPFSAPCDGAERNIPAKLERNNFIGFPPSAPVAFGCAVVFASKTRAKSSSSAAAGHGAGGLGVWK